MTYVEDHKNRKKRYSKTSPGSYPLSFNRPDFEIRIRESNLKRFSVRRRKSPVLAAGSRL